MSNHEILKLITNNNKLITTLYYRLRNSEDQSVSGTILYEITPPQNNLSFGSIMTLTNKDFQSIPNTLISYFGYRIVPSGTVQEVQGNFTESFNIQDKDNDRFQATATYLDDGQTTTTEIEQLSFVVVGGIGKYHKAKTAIIFYDNEGTKFGDGSNKFLRKIEIYS